MKRLILSIENSVSNIGSVPVRIKTVVYCLPLSVTSRTVKTNSIHAMVYVNGISGYAPVYGSLKPLTLKLSDPLAKVQVSPRSIREATQEAVRAYIMSRADLSKSLSGTVSYWSGNEGEIQCSVTGFKYSVFACNIQGAKTWFPETACVYLKQGETVTFDLSDMGDFLSASKVRGNVYTDEAKWVSLDQSSLAFKVDPASGKLNNGLFSQ